jgi:alkylation response protein AidB-like acyl-CoA dehydrogenase
VTFELTDEQHQLVEMVSDLLSARNRCRASLDGGPAIDTETWKSLVDLGVVALSASETIGGPGAQVIDEVLVAEQLGAAAAAVPVACVSAAATVLNALSGDPARALASSIFAEGRPVLLAVSARKGMRLGVTAQRHRDQWTLTGEITDVLEGAAAATLLVRADATDGPAYFAVEASAAADQPSLDQGQRLARLSLEASPATFVGRPADDGSLTASVLARVRLLLAAQALGAAARTLAVTVTYARQRVAFGQPIGRFQAIKHPLAEMLVMVENARSAVYNAAWSLDAGNVSQREVLMAKAVATENAVKVVHQSIQSHGGIGFTWEHELHLLLRRSKAAELALGQPDELFQQIGADLVAEQITSGLRSRPALNVVAADNAFREELRGWLDENLPAGWGTQAFRMPRGADERREFLRDMQRTFASGNWAGIHWPKEHGGRAATLAQQVIYNAELVGRGIPQMPGHRGLTIVGPTLIEHGTAAQRERFLLRIRNGADLWAGGFSEPEAGSDLASLRTRGVIKGDSVVVNGQKIWTSSAHWCNWIYTLVRTDPAAAKHEGISVVAIPLDAPGITVRPIRQMNGPSHFNEVFFEDVEVPVENIVGPVNEGWRVNRTTLSHEHFTLFIGSQARYRRSLDDIIDLARTAPWNTDGPAARSSDPHVQARLGRAWCTSQLIMINGLRNVARVESGHAPGAEGSIAKVFGQESEKHLFELAIDIAGPAGLLDRGAHGALGNGKWLFGYLGARAATIGGGTSEIHKNKIAEGVLGLPRDLWAENE